MVVSDAPGVVVGFLAGFCFDALVINSVWGFSVVCSVWSNFVIDLLERVELPLELAQGPCPWLFT